MRPLTYADVSTAARLLRGTSPRKRAALIDGMIAHAEEADGFRRQEGRWHPVWGNGTLEAVAHRHGNVLPVAFDDPDFLQCLALVIGALLRHRGSPSLSA